jgi:predicted phosphodiesterase
MGILQDKMNAIYHKGEKLLKINTTFEDKFIIFSDLHRGLGDMSDDFKTPNQQSYTAALDHYLANDYNLVHLGDVEELKEQWDIAEVLKFNERHLRQEGKFHERNKYFRVFGNHDSKYEKSATVAKHLLPYFPGLKVNEGIMLNYENLPHILLVHGHQDYVPFVTGFFEYIGLPVYRLYINMVNKNRDTNYDSYCKIEKSENVLYDWTISKPNLILVFGHTHRPLWGSRTHVEKIQTELKRLNDGLKDKAIEHKTSVMKLKENAVFYGVSDIIDTMKELLASLEKKIKQQGACSKPKAVPVIFNSGCCIFEDGDITGIEIDNGEIRLIKWGRDKITKDMQRIVLEQEYLGCLRAD